jgi:hypothetical protein
MARKRIMFGGQEYTAESIEFETDREHWNTYVLHDGTTLKLKAVVSEIVRIEGAYAPNGDPLYMVNSSNIVVTDVPENLRKPPTS